VTTVTGTIDYAKSMPDIWIEDFKRATGDSNARPTAPEAMFQRRKVAQAHAFPAQRAA